MRMIEIHLSLPQTEKNNKGLNKIRPIKSKLNKYIFINTYYFLRSQNEIEEYRKIYAEK